MEKVAKSIVFLSLDAHGHVNAMLGLADALKELKFRTIFVCNDNQAPKYFGHELILVRKWNRNNNQALPDILIEDVDKQRQCSGGGGSEEKVFLEDEQLNSKWSQMVDMLDLNVTNPDCVVESLTNNYKLLKLTIEHEIIPLDEKIEDILCYLKPNLVVVDTLCPYPALHRLSNDFDYAKKSGLSSPLNWISFTSCNPMLHYNAYFNGTFPPPLMGLSTRELLSPKRKGVEIEVEQSKYGKILEESEMVKTLFKLATLARLNLNQNESSSSSSEEKVEIMMNKFARNESKLMNIYMFPNKLDYCRDYPQFKLDEKLFVQVDSLIRKPLPVSSGSSDMTLLDKVSELRHYNDKSNSSTKIIYVSLGTTMSYNLKLISNVCKQVFACLRNHSDWCFVLSLGARFKSLDKSILEEIEHWQTNRKRLISSSWFPQPLLFERNLIDACVTHGGNNTLCELFKFKVAPRLVLIPAFHDQLDNARRVSELGMGVSIPAIKILTWNGGEDDKNNGADLLLLQLALERSFKLEQDDESKLLAGATTTTTTTGTNTGEQHNDDHYNGGNHQLRDSNYCARLIEAQILSKQQTRI